MIPRQGLRGLPHLAPCPGQHISIWSLAIIGTKLHIDATDCIEVAYGAFLVPAWIPGASCSSAQELSTRSDSHIVVVFAASLQCR